MSISGREPRFQEMFREEAGPGLDRLARDLLALESASVDPELVNSLFRDAHNLKGGAAMVGFEDVRVVAHAMEDVLASLRTGDAVATPEIIDGLLANVDTMRAMMAGGADPGRAVPGATPPDRPEPPESGPDPAGPRETTPPSARPGGVATPMMQLPVARLDEIARLVGEGSGAHSRFGRYVTETLHRDPDSVTGYRELAGVLNQLEERSTRARMVPVGVLAESLQRAVRDLARQLGKQIRWEATGIDTELDRSLLDKLAGPLLHIVRNSVDHGIEPPEQRRAAGKPEQGRITLHASHVGSEVVVVIADDGRGIDLDRVRAKAAELSPGLADGGDAEIVDLIFHSGLSTASGVSDVSGRGVGLDVVRANLASIRGRIEVQTELGASTEFRVFVPVSLSVLQCLVVRCGPQPYAIPLHSVVTVLAADTPTVRADGQTMVWSGGEPTPTGDLAATLGRPAAADVGLALVLASGERRHAFRVSEVVGKRGIVVNGLSPLLPRLPMCAGASAEADGSVLLVLDGTGLIDQAQALSRRVSPPTPRPQPPSDPGPVGTTGAGPDARAGRSAHTILVVDDALTVRELQHSILDRAGYTVLTARDGLDALAVAEADPPDLVLTDVEMPRMTGLELCRALRAHPRLSGVGIVVLTTLGGEEDRRAGLDAGADGYLVKRDFDEAKLLAAVRQILGEPQLPGEPP